MYVPPTMPPPLPPTSPPHVPPTLPPTLPMGPLPLIALPPSPSDLVSDKEDDLVVVEFQQKKWKEYVEGTKLKSVPFCQWQLKTIFGGSFFPGSPIAKNMTQLDFFLEILPIGRLSLIFTLTNVDLNRMILPATMRWEMIKKLVCYFNHVLLIRVTA